MTVGSGTGASVISMLEAEWAAVAALAAGFTDEEWSAPTSCPGWDVKDHVAHLVGTESWLAGEEWPPAAPEPGPHVGNPLAEANEAWVAAYRPRTGPEVLAAFEQVTARRSAALRAMTSDELDRPTDSPVGTVPYAVFMEVRLMDCFVHEQDLRDATGRPPRYDGPEAVSAVDRLTGALGVVVGKRCAAPEGASVVLELTGDAGRTVAVAVSDGRARVVPVPEHPTTRLTLAAADFVRLAAGRVVGAEAVAAVPATVEGDQDLGRAVLAQLRTVP